MADRVAIASSEAPLSVNGDIEQQPEVYKLHMRAAAGPLLRRHRHRHRHRK